MKLSILFNIVLAASAAAAVARHCSRAPARVVFRYFTVLSNVLCAAAAALVVIFRISGSLPYAVGVLKYMGTVTVTVTLLTVLFFLGPTMGYKLMFTGADLWLHLICPLLAIISCCLWDKPKMPLGVVGLGVLPVVLYGALYLKKAVLDTSERSWKDFYGFNRGGHWKISYLVMVAATLLISWLLWLA